MLSDKTTGFARGLDRCLRDGGDRGLKLLQGEGGNTDQSRAPLYAVTGGQFGFLLEYSVILGRVGGILDLPDLRSLGPVADVLDLLLAQVAGSLIGAQGV